MFVVLPVDQLPSATDGDMYARASVASERISHGPWAGHGAVIWAISRRGRTGFVGVGAPGNVAALLANVRPEVPTATRATLAHGWMDHIAPSLAAVVVKRMDWDWCWTVAPPEQVPGEDRAYWLTTADAGDVRKLLAEASPETSTWPDDDHAHRWAGGTRARSPIWFRPTRRIRHTGIHGHHSRSSVPGRTQRSSSDGRTYVTTTRRTRSNSADAPNSGG